MSEVRDDFPNWDRATQKLMNDAFRVERLVSPPIYKWVEYTDDDGKPYGETDGRVLKINIERIQNG